MPLELQFKTSAEGAASRRPAFGRPGRGRVGDVDRMFFTEQLALLLETGANVYNALRTLREQTKKPALAAVIDALLADVGEGQPFSRALARHPGVFSASYINLVAASEGGGFLHTVLYELKSMEEKRAELKSALSGALAYPAFLLAFSIAVIVFILLVVFPKFGDMFARIYDDLPVTTRFLMGASRLLLDHGVYAALAVAAVIAMSMRWAATPAGHDAIDRALLRAPLARDILAELYLVQVLRVISLSLGNGVSMVDTLRACRDLVPNTAFRRLLDTVAQRVQEGTGMARGFAEAAFVPAIALAMIRTGEESGRLAPVTARVADYYEQRLTRRLKTLSRMAEPVMLLVMGAVVGLVVSSLILPIFKLARAVS